MTSSSLDFNEFKSAPHVDWLNAANSQLKIENVEEKLSWKIVNDLELPPYFDKSNATDFGYLIYFFSKIRFDWQLFRTIDVENEKQANSEALEALNEGCTGVLFKLVVGTNLLELTQNILFDHCQVSFAYQPGKEDEINKFKIENGVKGFCHTMGVSSKISQADSIDEMVKSLVQFSKNEFSNSLIIHVGSNFFFEIARLRSMRYLVNRVKEALGVESSLWIHAEVDAAELEDKNLLVQTSAGLSAVLGGANSISFNSRNDNNRISTNVGNLIREEANIRAFSDASSGSYYIDYLTDSLIRKTWANFQNIVI